MLSASLIQLEYVPKQWKSTFSYFWEGFGVEEATWEPFSAFVLPEGCLNSVLVDYLSQNNLEDLLRLPQTLASQKKPRD